MCRGLAAERRKEVELYRSSPGEAREVDRLMQEVGTVEKEMGRVVQGPAAKRRREAVLNRRWALYFGPNRINYSVFE